MSETVKKTLPVKGIHCASCASIIERKINKLDGVTSCEVSIGVEKAKLEYDPNKVDIKKMNEVITPVGYTIIDEEETNGLKNEEGENLEMSKTKKEKLKELSKQKIKVWLSLPVSLAVFFLMGWEILASEEVRSLTNIVIPDFPIPMEIYKSIMLVVATFIMFYIGSPFIKEVGVFIKYRVANMYTLVGIGTLVAYLFSSFIVLFPELSSSLNLPMSTYFDVTIVVIGFITLGKFLETKSKIQTGEAIEKLIDLQAKKATLDLENLRADRIKDLQSKGYELTENFEINISDIIFGDIVLVKPGGKIPIDGVITEGITSIDESMITGEPLPVDKKTGENVVGGTINKQGYIKVKAVKIGSETVLSQIIKMVEDAQGSKAPIQKLADQISARFVPTVLIISLVTLFVWLTLGAYFLGFSVAFSLGILCFVGVLVIACPCALGLATPTAIVTGTGLGAKNGILIKNAESLEKLHKVKTVIMDKTGTITEGRPILTDIEINDKNKIIKNEKDALTILASLESLSEHPIANAILNNSNEKKLKLLKVESFESIEGKGVKGKLNYQKNKLIIYAGNEYLANELKVEYDRNLLNKLTEEGKTPIVLMGGLTEKSIEALGIFAVSDKIKENAKESIAYLHKLGIKVIMLTGDDIKAAKYIANQVGIDDVVANVLPQDKALKVKEIQELGKGSFVAMVGDGINDAPALAQSDVGIAMSTGTDIAIDSAEIVLLKGDISKIYKAIKLSKITIRTIKQNLFWAFFYNILGIPLAAGLFFPFFGIILNPIFAGLAMAISSVSVVTNSLRLKFIKL